MRAFVVALLMVALLGCDRPGGARPSAKRLTSGEAVVVCVPRRLALWVQLRANALTRVQGWGIPETPSMVVYESRGYNPVLIPEGKKVQVVWLDGDRVTGIVPETAGNDGMVLPRSEVTRAVLVPPGISVNGLAPGDILRVVQ